MFETLCGLIAFPAKHSLSADIYNPLFKKDNIKAEYKLYEIDQESFYDFLENKDFFFLNLSMPYKQKIISKIHNLQGEAKILNLCNLVITKEGQTTAYATDGLGFFRDLDYKKITYKGRHLTIIGAGATAKEIICEAFKENVGELTILQRGEHFQKNENEIEGIIKNLGYNKSTSIKFLDLADETEIRKLSPIDILLNATPVDSDSLITKSIFENCVNVFTLKYSKEPLVFLKTARENGSKETFSGLGLLISQAMENYKILTGLTPNRNFIENNLNNKN